MKKFIILLATILTVFNLSGCGNDTGHYFESMYGYKFATSIKYPSNTIMVEDHEVLAVNNNNELLAFYHIDENTRSAVPNIEPYKIMDDVVAVSSDGLDKVWAMKSNGDLYEFDRFSYSRGDFNPVKIMDDVRYIYKKIVVRNNNEFWQYETGVHAPKHEKLQSSAILGINEFSYIRTDGELRCYYKAEGSNSRADWHTIATDVAFASSFANNNIFYITSNGSLYVFDENEANDYGELGVHTLIADNVKDVFPTWSGPTYFITKDGFLYSTEPAYGEDFYDTECIMYNVNSVYDDDSRAALLILKENGELWEQQTFTEGNGEWMYPAIKLADNIKLPTGEYELSNKTNDSKYSKYIGKYYIWTSPELEVHSMTATTVTLTIPNTECINKMLPLADNSVKVKVDGGKYKITFKEDEINMVFLSGWRAIPTYEYNFWTTDGM